MPGPSYLLTDIPDELRQAITEESLLSDRAIASLVRQALTEHFGIQAPRRYRTLGKRMVIRADPELFAAIKGEAESKDQTMKQVILDILADRFEVALGS